MTNTIRGSANGQQSSERSLGYYKHSYDDDYVYNPDLNSHTNYTQIVRNYETTAKSFANNATIIARGYYDAASAADWDAVIVPLLAITVVLSFCLGCCMGRCGRDNNKDDDGMEDLISIGSRKKGRRSSRQNVRKTRSGTPRRRYNLEESYDETDNESYYDRYEKNETDDDYDSDGTGYYYEPPGSPSSLSDYRSAQRESAARRKTRAATKRAAIAMKAKATAEAALAVATAKSDTDNKNNSKEENEKTSNPDWSPTSKQTEVEKKAAKANMSALSTSSSTMAASKKSTRQWGKIVTPKKKIDPLLEARSRGHNFLGYYVT